MTLDQRVESLEKSIGFMDDIITYLYIENRKLRERIEYVEDKQEEQSNSIEDLELITEEIKTEVDYSIK